MRTNEHVRVGLAAHSLRAVPRPALLDLAIHARRQGMPFHMHVAEQPREVDQCLDAYGLRPVEVLAEDGILDMGVVAVHATHLTPAEIELLGAAQSTICLCRTTERDLGDGLPATAELYRAGVQFCVGTDSHASSDAFEEIRAVELDERSRTTTRHVVAEVPALFAMATYQGYLALGLNATWPHDTVTLDLHDASLAGSSAETDLDGLLFGATPRAVRDVTIAEKLVVRDGQHIRYDEARRGYETALRRLGLLA